jgi:hypothetical protein
MLSPECKKNPDINVVNRSFENMAQLKYFQMPVTNQNFISEDIKRALHMGNASFYSFQNVSVLVCFLKMQ